VRLARSELGGSTCRRTDDVIRRSPPENNITVDRDGPPGRVVPRVGQPQEPMLDAVPLVVQRGRDRGVLWGGVRSGHSITP
jgi:hypothetical protein